MFIARSLKRTYQVATLLAANMAAHGGASAATAMAMISCRGTTMQNACKHQEVCIDDPRALPQALIFSLSMKDRTYKIGGITGRIVSVGFGQTEIRDLKIEPAIEGDDHLELATNWKRAKLVGGDYNYFFECRKARH